MIHRSTISIQWVRPLLQLQLCTIRTSSTSMILTLQTLLHEQSLAVTLTSSNMHQYFLQQDQSQQLQVQVNMVVTFTMTFTTQSTTSIHVSTSTISQITVHSYGMNSDSHLSVEVPTTTSTVQMSRKLSMRQSMLITSSALVDPTYSHMEINPLILLSVLSPLSSNAQTTFSSAMDFSISSFSPTVL